MSKLHIESIDNAKAVLESLLDNDLPLRPLLNMVEDTAKQLRQRCTFTFEAVPVPTKVGLQYFAVIFDYNQNQPKVYTKDMQNGWIERPYSKYNDVLLCGTTEPYNSKKQAIAAATNHALMMQSDYDQQARNGQNPQTSILDFVPLGAKSQSVKPVTDQPQPFECLTCGADSLCKTCEDMETLLRKNTNLSEPAAQSFTPGESQATDTASEPEPVPVEPASEPEPAAPVEPASEPEPKAKRPYNRKPQTDQPAATVEPLPVEPKAKRPRTEKPLFTTVTKAAK